MPLLLPIRRAMELIAGSTWPKKITKFLCGLIVFFSATQFGLHFWPESAFVYGLRIDYLSPTLYFLDLLIFLYLFLLSIQKSKIKDLKSFLVVLPILLVNLLYSQNPLTTLSWSFHLILYLVFISTLSKNVLRSLFSVLSFVIFFQVILSIVQVIQGHSVQGVLYFFGERMVSVGLPSVAVGSFMGQVILRAYGTFSHPNILAGYSVISLLIVLYLTKLRKLSPIFYILYSMFISLIVVLTQSRSAALSLFGLVIPFYLLKSLRFRLLYFILVLFSIFYILYSGTLSRPLDLSISERHSLQQVSLKVINAYPIFGVGANASITRYPDLVPNFRLFQPDHNSLTLFISWFGFVGVSALLLIHKSNIINLKSLLPLLPLLLLDHYLLTSPQCLFVLLLYFRIFWLTDNPVV